MNPSPAYEVYHKELLAVEQGVPLWNPVPTEHGEVRPGDVGYIRKGAFYRLFNVLEDAQSPANVGLQVPPHFRRLPAPCNRAHASVFPARRLFQPARGSREGDGGKRMTLGLTTQINLAGDAYLHDDFAFGTRDGLISEAERHTDPAEIRARGLNEPFSTITFDFVLLRDDAAVPDAVVVRQHAPAQAAAEAA